MLKKIECPGLRWWESHGGDAPAASTTGCFHMNFAFLLSECFQWLGLRSFWWTGKPPDILASQGCFVLVAAKTHERYKLIKFIVPQISSLCTPLKPSPFQGTVSECMASPSIWFLTSKNMGSHTISHLTIHIHSPSLTDVSHFSKTLPVLHRHDLFWLQTLVIAS